MDKPFLFLFSNCKKTVDRKKSFWQVAILICFLTFPAIGSEWSETEPKINIKHIFEGEINRRGKPVGFHVMRDGFKNSRIIRVISEPNSKGVYTAEVEIFDVDEKRWKRKSFSSFFPDNWTDPEIISAIINAYQNDDIKNPSKFGGPSEKGVRVEGWLCPKGGRPNCPDGAINTAYPIFKE